MEVRFSQPAVSQRPPKSHRFDVYGLKISRPLMLFNRGPLGAWIELERTPAVTWYCERPVVLEEAGKKRVIDFYAIRDGREELLLCPTKMEEEDPESCLQAWPGFIRWCEHSGIEIGLVSQNDKERSAVSVGNWSQVIRELVAFRRHVSSDLVSAVASELRMPHQLSALQDLFRNTDPILVKVALFQLLHQGLATGDDLEVAPFSADMVFRAS
jgi:hypothetical protein